jgi:hypothetical protein
MSLNDLKLTSQLASSLFTTSLVIPGEISVEEPGPPAPKKQVVKESASIQHLGNNEKNILIVVDYPGLVYLPDGELTFLTNLLSACKLSLADVAIFNRHHLAEKDSKRLLDDFQPGSVLLFGIDPITFGLPVGFPQFQIQKLAGCTFLFAPSLGEYENDKLLKSKLWVCLRSIFGI